MLLKEVLEIYIERKEWFLELIIQHILLSAIAIVLAGCIGLLLGILIPFAGIGNKTAIIALTLYGIMPMVRNTYAGIKGVDADIILAALGMGSTEWQIMTKIKLPGIGS